MLCENCGKREANVRYTENINGKRKELNLCEECSKKLGIGQMDFSMPVDFSSFLGGFMDELATPDFMPIFNTLKQSKCDECGSTFEDIINTGNIGCQNCYNTFEDELDTIIKRLQGSNRHIGRIGKIIDSKIDKKLEPEDKKASKNENSKKQSNEKIEKQEGSKEDKKEILKMKLEQAIKEERYEDADKIRDQIQELEK